MSRGGPLLSYQALQEEAASEVEQLGLTLHSEMVESALQHGSLALQAVPSSTASRQQTTDPQVPHKPSQCVHPFHREAVPSPN